MNDKTETAGGELVHPDSALPAARQHHAIAIKDPVLQMIADAAVNPAVDIDKFERLMALKERQDAKLAEVAFNKALRLAQKKIGPIVAATKNRATGSKYPKYHVIDAAIRPIYTKGGFSLSFNSRAHADPTMMTFLCYVSHDKGHTREYEIDLPADGKGPKGADVMTRTHAAVSATSYSKRCLVGMVFNLATIDIDDDGNAAGATPQPRITDSQAADLKSLIEEVNADPVAFTNWLRTQKVDRGLIENISVKFYPEVVRMLERKRGQAPKQRQEQPQ